MRLGCLNCFRLNTPEYFSESEENDLALFLENEIEHYFVLLVDDVILGCGGFNFVGRPTDRKDFSGYFSSSKSRKRIGNGFDELSNWAHERNWKHQKDFCSNFAIGLSFLCQIWFGIERSGWRLLGRRFWLVSVGNPIVICYLAVTNYEEDAWSENSEENTFETTRNYGWLFKGSGQTFAWHREERCFEMFEIRDFASILHIHPTHMSNTIKLATGKHPCYFYEEKIFGNCQRNAGNQRKINWRDCYFADVWSFEFHQIL